METKKILQADLLDILFDQRNKAYGAYELRKHYAQRARRALGFALLLALLAVSAPLIASWMGAGHHTESLYRMDHPTKLTDLPTVPPPLILPPRPPRTTGPKPAGPPTVIVKAITDPLPKNPDPITPSIPGPAGPQISSQIQDPVYTGPSLVQSVIDQPKDDNETFSDLVVEQLPEFPGGEDALLAYLNDHIHYPGRAVASEVSGRVILGFVVNKKGEIDELKVIRGVGYGCDEEAIRVVSNMPRWKPGRNNGKPVSVYFNLPIQFVLK